MTTPKLQSLQGFVSLLYCAFCAIAPTLQPVVLLGISIPAALLPLPVLCLFWYPQVGKSIVLCFVNLLIMIFSPLVKALNAIRNRLTR
ncbi:hypothetical protein F8514_29990 [Bacillus toyonensis]|uniref:hypothetical protein n=1 Tax=Bacillus toyonensis TaxID=155322 RepID=UPI000BF941D9|nr:hypothetical protein [Bacillus toyonensis]KAB2400829.1 hypothetical protein F8514_29990 [Bacillus toyonensis]PFK03466.1 hypothetical protein COI97_14475 [Bacillus cereus]